MKSKTFKIGQFRLLDSLKARLQYLRTRVDVEEAGHGSSRIAFYINDRKQVLKLAKWQRGRAQNKNEYTIINSGNSKYFPKTYSKAANYSWIIVDAVRPIRSSREFERLTGIPLRAVEVGIELQEPEIQNRKDTDPTKKKWNQVYQRWSRNPWYAGLIKTAIKNNLISGDIGKWDSWGVTKRGRVVLVDYGLTKEVWKTYYSRVS